MESVNASIEQCKTSSMQLLSVKRFIIRLVSYRQTLMFGWSTITMRSRCYGKTPMQTWNDSLHPAKEKLLSNHYQNVVSLPLSSEVETGSAGEQPVRNNLADWNGQGD